MHEGTHASVSDQCAAIQVLVHPPAAPQVCVRAHTPARGLASRAEGGRVVCVTKGAVGVADTALWCAALAEEQRRALGHSQSSRGLSKNKPREGCRRGPHEPPRRGGGPMHVHALFMNDLLEVCLHSWLTDF